MFLSLCRYIFRAVYFILFSVLCFMCVVLISGGATRNAQVCFTGSEAARPRYQLQRT